MRVHKYQGSGSVSPADPFLQASHAAWVSKGDATWRLTGQRVKYRLQFCTFISYLSTKQKIGWTFLHLYVFSKRKRDKNVSNIWWFGSFNKCAMCMTSMFIQTFKYPLVMLDINTASVLKILLQIKSRIIQQVIDMHNNKDQFCSFQ